ncbi:MAG: hypothetical protein LAT75_04880 [Candidatus Cyclonatronum sp.]|uniref:hypothetical protein n=1 Tax=Cyclonatronum sp. TaxID=3024185 RepID=UPI0025C4595E|nr:hypothetical protein [Cyclonatronum sp.]MCC5933565.1 hypothetical protein [Balneolales bacterium]MCH8486177.1 hypothetical protein [Cyclonatronum sp.]
MIIRPFKQESEREDTDGSKTNVPEIDAIDRLRMLAAIGLSAALSLGFFFKVVF